MKPQTHSLADLQGSHVLTDAGDAPYNFVPWNEWVLRKSPFVINHSQISMADPGVEHVQLDLTGTEFAWIVFKWR
jgi:hypothetical protein